MAMEILVNSIKDNPNKKEKETTQKTTDYKYYKDMHYKVSFIICMTTLIIYIYKKHKSLKEQRELIEEMLAQKNKQK